jgi:endonuclease YncB( thermonuclease family)
MRHLLGSLTALILAVTGATLLVTAGPASAHTDKDCSDFATQAAAQAYYVSLGGPSSDPDRLDGDGDGVACDSNPCPCSTGTGGGGGGGTAGTTNDDSTPTGRTHRDRARVVRVVDGDTYDVRLSGGRKVRVRVLGIDTPEVYGATECGGPEASARAKRFLPRGTRVVLTSDPSQQLEDRYGRSLRYVAKNGKDIGRSLVRAGLARVYVYDHEPFKRTRAYQATQRAAQRADRGIWGSC